MKNPYVFTGVMILLLIAGWFVGKNWSTWFPKGNGSGNTTPPKDGTVCTAPDGKAGVISGGVCVTTGGPKPVEEDDSARSANSNNAPATIIVAQGTKTPFSHMGCTYGKPYPSPRKGYWIVTKISCP